jgi:hypothetical protein
MKKLEDTEIDLENLSQVSDEALNLRVKALKSQRNSNSRKEGRIFRENKEDPRLYELSHENREIQAELDILRVEVYHRKPEKIRLIGSK